MIFSKMFEILLGPSTAMVKQRHHEKMMTKVAEAEHEERRLILARLKAIEVSLPAAYHIKQRN